MKQIISQKYHDASPNANSKQANRVRDIADTSDSVSIDLLAQQRPESWSTMALMPTPCTRHSFQFVARGEAAR